MTPNEFTRLVELARELNITTCSQLNEFKQNNSINNSKDLLKFLEQNKGE